MMVDEDPEVGGRQSDPLPVPASLVFEVGQLLTALSEPARALVEAASVLESPAPLPRVGLLAGVTDPYAALEAALATGLINWDSGGASTSVAVTDQLCRKAVLETLTPCRLCRLHAAAAPLVNRAQSWAHRVTAAKGPDNALAEELEQAAAERLRDGDLQQAATLLLWASDLGESQGTRENNLLMAVRAMTGVWLGRLYAMLGRGDAMVEYSRTAMPHLASLGTRLARHARGNLALGRAYSDGVPSGLEELEDVPTAAQAGPGDADLLTCRGALRIWSGHFRSGMDDLSKVLGFLSDGTVPAAPELLHPALSLAQYTVGDWDAAVRTAEAALDVAMRADTPWAAPIGQATASHVLAGRGQLEAARHLLAQTEAWVGRIPAVALPQLAVGRALLAQAQRDPEQMLAAVEPLRHASAEEPAAVSELWWRPLEAEALINTGRRAEARTALKRLEELAYSAPCLTTPGKLGSDVLGLAARLVCDQLALPWTRTSSVLVRRRVGHRAERSETRPAIGRWVSS